MTQASWNLISRFLGLSLFAVAGCTVEAVGSPEELEEEARASVGGARFGTYCQVLFENDWQDEVIDGWDRCSAFNDELDDTDTKVFYWNLQGAKPFWEGASDQVYVEDVNLMFTNTHGGGWTNSAVYAMWDDGDLVHSTDLRWGNEGHGLSIFASYACETLKYSDDRTWHRWNAAMKGGLRIILGSHDEVWNSDTTDEIGEDFADNIQGGQSLRNAWKDALSDWNHDQDVTAVSFGNSLADCESRRDGMTWQNYTSYPRRRDGDVTHWCYVAWENL
ncbi:DUF6345 domain-containing protein [Sorangium sp. So ce542]|uniref:DUF6345 domain-containing protein n=1 Tax=Sorangium sp. So ce542 TaxID=3133316 RepID=UPI003F601D8D